MSIEGALNGLLRLAIAAAVIGAGAFAVTAVLDRLALDSQAAERRALLQRNAELNVSVLAPGSALACLDGGAGEAIESACEKAVFANAQSAAAAVAYVGARLALLKDASDFAKRNEPAFIEAFAGARRALELDRYGIVAHVLTEREGCTLERCAAFALLRDTAALTANLRGAAFDTYVARYADAWNKTEPEKQIPVAAAPAATPAPVASVAAPAELAGRPLSSKYDFPSAASIPPVSIMNAEPPLPKEQPDRAAAAPVTEGAAPAARLPLPPKRPQAQAATPPAR